MKQITGTMSNVDQVENRECCYQTVQERESGLVQLDPKGSRGDSSHLQEPCSEITGTLHNTSNF